MGHSRRQLLWTNKNNTVIKFLFFLTDAKHIKKASLNFFIKGHTKNNCDRGFGNLERKYAHSDVWSLRQLVDIMGDSATSSNAVLLENSQCFRSFREPLNTPYKDLSGLTKYLMFVMSSDKPGVVICRKRPSDPGDSRDLLRKVIAKDMTDGHVRDIWRCVKPVEPNAINPEKLVDLFKKLKDYIPPEHVRDPLYRLPPRRVLFPRL
ncbi:TPA: hypothetical protein N0F65_006004 [Lagenidium giganteum]|uniref:DUF7869 domain-containing protein n=1 Tax=Lagenidium giganteum TaxID=4803 RepID=A0AAV2Z3E6_9STRA|nr:TPA: hypothetical protein N0F65_006004 [Lagenidium giganteum]